MSTTSNFWQTWRPAHAIGKKRAYVTLPTFQAIRYPYLGKAVIVTLFNYTATNNFTLVSLPVKPVLCNFILCISWSADALEHRYKLWSNDIDGCFYPLYTGQLIKKNFRLEVWTTDSEAVNLNAAVNLNLSILSPKSTLIEVSTYLNTTGVQCSTLNNVDSPALQTNLTALQTQDIDPFIDNATAFESNAVGFEGSPSVFYTGPYQLNYIRSAQGALKTLTGKYTVGTWEVLAGANFDEATVVGGFGNTDEYDTLEELVTALVAAEADFINLTNPVAGNRLWFLYDGDTSSFDDTYTDFPLFTIQSLFPLPMFFPPCVAGYSN